MTRRAKAGLVFAGYALAFIAAMAAAYLRQVNCRAGVECSSGMHAFGDLLYFLAVFSFIALAPSALFFYFLRSSIRLWRYLAAVSLLFAGTGPPAAVLLIFYNELSLAAMSPLRLIASFLAAPFFILGALIAQERLARLALFVAGVLECLSAVAAWLHLAGIFSAR